MWLRMGPADDLWRTQGYDLFTVEVHHLENYGINKIPVMMVFYTFITLR